MQHTVSQTQLRQLVLSLPESRPVVGPAHDRAAPRAGGILSMWRDAWATLATHSPPILALALAGFTLVDAVGLGISLLLSLDQYLRDRTAFCTFQGSPGVPVWPLVLWGVIAIPAQGLARGALTVIAAPGSDAGEAPSLRAAWQQALAHWPALLLGRLVYGFAMLVVAIGIALPLMVLDLAPTDPQGVTAPWFTATLVRRDLTSYSVSAIVPEPGPPFCTVAAFLRDQVLERRNVIADSARKNVMIRSLPEGLVSAPIFWPITLGSLLLATVAEVLLRFWVAAALTPARAAGHSRLLHFAPLIDGVHLAWAHFTTVVAHVWLLRLIMASTRVTFVLLPIVLAEQIVLPRVAQSAGTPWLYPVCVVLAALSGVLVNGILTAFCTVYDTRLFFALRPGASRVVFVDNHAQRACSAPINGHAVAIVSRE